MPSRSLPFGSDALVIPAYFARGSGADDPGFQAWKREHPDCFAAGDWIPAAEPRQDKPPASDGSGQNGTRRLSPTEVAELASFDTMRLDPASLSVSDFQRITAEARAEAARGSSSGDTATEGSVPDLTPTPNGFAQKQNQISDGPSPSHSPRLPNQDMSLSGNGQDLLYQREAQAGVTDHTHWPGGGSGVTIGPGYDMGARTADQVRSDLEAIGLGRQAAATLSTGAGLRGAEAQKFAQAHASDASLTEQQQHDLLNLTDQNAQQAVRTNVHVPLNQNQYDALVSFAYNVGPGAFNNSTLLSFLNNGDYNGAAEQFERWNRSNGEIVGGLVNRRAAELRQFQSP